MKVGRHSHVLDAKGDLLRGLGPQEEMGYAYHGKHRRPVVVFSAPMYRAGQVDYWAHSAPALTTLSWNSDNIHPFSD